MNELKRSLANRFSELSYNPSAISIGSDGFVFRLNKNLVAKLFTGDQTTACHAACSQFAAVEGVDSIVPSFPVVYTLTFCSRSQNAFDCTVKISDGHGSTSPFLLGSFLFTMTGVEK